MMDQRPDPTAEMGVDLYWIPLGVGSPVVQASGRLFEAASAARHRRPRCDIYHSALVVSAPEGRFTIEQAPVPDRDGASRGVVAVGPVGLRALGRFRFVRYEVRCWRDGIIPDLDAAVDSPVRVTTDAAVASKILVVLPRIPTPVWGRDAARTGEMWNCNSVIAWTLTSSGIDVDVLTPPDRGRVPGWSAGRIVAEAEMSSGGERGSTDPADQPSVTGIERGPRT
jgi:hypothetical protein